MKFSLECEVESSARLEKEVIVQDECKEYIFRSNKNGFFSWIKITKKIKDSEEFVSKIIPHALGPGHHKLEIKSDKEILDEITAELQYLETTIMFGGSPTKINWESPNREWIPENETEKKNINVTRFEYKKEYPLRVTNLDKEYLVSIIQSKEDYDELTILEAFHNDGIRFFNEFKFINAFYNFYFVIEDLYGGGNTRNRLIQKSFKKSNDLRRFIEWMLNNNIKTHKRHYKMLIELLRDANKSESIDDIIELLVRIRGRLHHFTRKNTLKIGTPFNQREYETIALLTMGLSLRGILQETYYINKKLGIAT